MGPSWFKSNVFRRKSCTFGETQRMLLDHSCGGWRLINTFFAFLPESWLFQKNSETPNLHIPDTHTYLFDICMMQHRFQIPLEWIKKKSLEWSKTCLNTIHLIKKWIISCFILFCFFICLIQQSDYKVESAVFLSKNWENKSVKNSNAETCEGHVYK